MIKIDLKLKILRKERFIEEKKNFGKIGVRNNGCFL